MGRDLLWRWQLRQGKDKMRFAPALTPELEAKKRCVR